MFHISREPILVLLGILSGKSTAFVEHVVCNVVVFPKPVTIDDADIHSMSYVLIAVVLVTKRGKREFLASERSSNIQMNVAFLLRDSDKNAV